MLIILGIIISHVINFVGDHFNEGIVNFSVDTVHKQLVLTWRLISSFILVGLHQQIQSVQVFHIPRFGWLSLFILLKSKSFEITNWIKILFNFLWRLKSYEIMLLKNRTLNSWSISAPVSSPRRLQICCIASSSILCFCSAEIPHSGVISPTILSAKSCTKVICITLRQNI